MVGFSSETFSEVIFTGKFLDRILVYPLGVKLIETNNKCLLYARVFPGTGLHRNIDRVVDACIAAPYNPLTYYYAVFKKNFTMSLGTANAIHSPCIKPAAIEVETIVLKREHDNEKGLVRILLDPVHLRYYNPITYQRVFGCIVEMLIDYTRIDFYSRRKTGYGNGICDILEKLITRIINSYYCVLHSTTNTTYHRVAYEVLRKSVNLLGMGGCTPPRF